MKGLERGLERGLKGYSRLQVAADVAKDGMNWIDSSIEMGECYSYQVRATRTIEKTGSIPRL